MARDAGSLHCPNCGAPAAPGDASCPYCHASLATVSCPSCFALMFESAIYCPSCGARRARTAGSARRAPCPACRGVMREVDIGQTSLLECDRCHGTWLDAATFEHVCADRETQAAVLHSPSPVPPPANAEVRYRPCVACGKLMNRLNFGRLSGTIVDVCKGHGTFLDAGELHAIVQFIQGGGLDRARQRQLEELKEEELRLRTLQNQGDGTEVSIESRSWSGLDLLSLLDQMGRPRG
jgi:Zn-finger nucleic acid-binding protein